MVCPPEVSARSSALLHEVGHFLLRGIQTWSIWWGKRCKKMLFFFHQISLTIQVRQWIFYEVILKFKHPHGPPWSRETAWNIASMVSLFSPGLQAKGRWPSTDRRGSMIVPWFCLWFIEEYHGIPWNTMEYHGIPWNTMEYHWTRPLRFFLWQAVDMAIPKDIVELRWYGRCRSAANGSSSFSATGTDCHGLGPDHPLDVFANGMGINMGKPPPLKSQSIQSNFAEVRIIATKNLGFHTKYIQTRPSLWFSCSGSGHCIQAHEYLVLGSRERRIAAPALGRNGGTHEGTGEN